MPSSMEKLLLMFVLCIASLSHVKAADKVSVNDFKMDIKNTEMVGSWDSELANSLLDATVNVNQNCPGPFVADIVIYEGNNVVNAMTKNFEQPFEHVRKLDICSTVDAPEPDDESCAAAQGEHTMKGCDMRDWFSDLSSGDYTITVDFKQDNALVCTATIGVKVE